MKKHVWSTVWLATAAAGLGSAAAVAQFPETQAPAAAPALAQQQAAAPKAAAVPAASGLDMDIMHIQVLLDRADFSPGVIDGKPGISLDDAVRGYQEANGLEETGKLDDETRALLMRDKRPAVRKLAIDARDLQGQFVAQIPDEPADKARLDHLGYRNAVEKLAEKFHTTPQTILALNDPRTPLRAGTVITLPDVLPSSRSYDGIAKDEHAQLLSDLNVDGETAKGDRVVVDKSDRVLKVFDGERLIAQFPATMGSARDPLPLGTWKITTTAYLPPWHYQPEILKTADKSDPDMIIKPGPNNPVGVAWLDLTKEHYGIHGTGDPQAIGRAESNGCIRLTNWDVARLSRIVAPGTTAVFQA